MNGWQRLFVLVAALLCVPTFLVWLAQKPDEDRAFYVAGCEPSYYYRKDAEEELRQGTFEQARFSNENCGVSLTKLVQGELHAERTSAWKDDFWEGAYFLAIFLTGLYALGAGLGWVWRGFRQKNT